MIDERRDCFWRYVARQLNAFRRLSTRLAGGTFANSAHPSACTTQWGHLTRLAAAGAGCDG